MREHPGNREVWIKLSRLNQATREGIRHGFFALGKALKREANRAILKRPRHGEVYRKRYASGAVRYHAASLPYETHANWSGKLRKSIGWVVAGFSKRYFGYGVSRGNEPEYAGFVEGGTFGLGLGRSGARGGRMAPRPSLWNAIKATRKDAQVSFVEAINWELRK